MTTLTAIVLLTFILYFAVLIANSPLYMQVMSMSGSGKSNLNVVNNFTMVEIYLKKEKKHMQLHKCREIIPMCTSAYVHTHSFH